MAILVTLDGMIVLAHPLTKVLEDVKIIALQLFLLSYTEFPGATLMVFKPQHPMKVPQEITCTLDGIVILVKLPHPRNALAKMRVTLDGIVMFFKVIHPANAP